MCTTLYQTLLDVEGSIIQYWLHQTLDPLDTSQLKQSKNEFKQAKEKDRQLHKTLHS